MPDRRREWAVFRSAAVLAMTLALAGCGSYGANLAQVSALPEGRPTSAGKEPAGEADKLQAEASAPAPKAAATPRRLAHRTAGSSASSGMVDSAAAARSFDATFSVVQPTAANAPRRPPAPGAASPTPKVGSPEWTKEHAETERKERRLDQIIRSICRGC
jgi:hypothetical protein